MSLADAIFQDMQTNWLCYDYNPNIIKCSVPFFNITDQKLLFFIKSIFDEIIQNFNNKQINLESYKDDTNIIVFVLKHVVIKIYSIDKYLAIAPLLFINHPNVEKVIATYSLDTMVVTVTEKITPLLNCYGVKNTNIEWASISREDIREQITKALTVIHNLKYLHNDVSFDNMGLKKNGDNNTFILYDFGGSTYNKNASIEYKVKDYTCLHNAIKKHLK